MKKSILLVSLLLAAVLVSGCTQQAEPPTDGGDEGPSGNLEASAYDQIEQEMEQAIEDIDLGDLESELLT